LKALIEINHQVIAEHDNIILAGSSQNSQLHGGPPPSLSHGMSNMGGGDYENCVSALR